MLRKREGVKAWDAVWGLRFWGWGGFRNESFRFRDGLGCATNKQLGPIGSIYE